MYKFVSINSYRLNVNTVLDEIRQAIDKQDAEAISTYLRDSTFELPQTLDSNGQSTLHIAVKSKNIQILDMFLDYYERAMLNVNIRDRWGWHVCVGLYTFNYIVRFFTLLFPTALVLMMKRR
jgi:hypothetical protein